MRITSIGMEMQPKWIKGLFWICVIICSMEKSKSMTPKNAFGSMKMHRANLSLSASRIKLTDQLI